MYFHVTKDKRNKLEAIEGKCIFVGYCEYSKEFILYIPSQSYFEISMDVMFDEDATLRKARDLSSPPPSKKKKDDMDI